MASVRRSWVWWNYLGFNHYIVCSTLRNFRWWIHQSWISSVEEWRTGILSLIFLQKIIKYWEVFIVRLGFISRKNFTRMWSKTLFNPRSNILTKSSKIPILDLNITRIHMDTVYRTTTGLFSNWKVHSTSTMMFNLHVCHLQRHILDWILQKNNVSQVDGDL